MKIFSNIQELWAYCSFCPVCQSDKREVYVTVGPDAVFSLNSFSKQDSLLELQCAYKKKQNIYSVQYKIDCNTNLFDVAVTNIQIVITDSRIPLKKITEAYFYFYIQASCPQCECSSAHSVDLELDIVDKKISNLELERETFLLLNETDKFNITIIHDRNVMLISRLCGADDFHYREDEKSIELPLVKLDLLNQARAVSKIKTLILFS